MLFGINTSPFTTAFFIFLTSTLRKQQVVKWKEKENTERFKRPEKEHSSCECKKKTTKRVDIGDLLGRTVFCVGWAFILSSVDYSAYRSEAGFHHHHSNSQTHGWTEIAIVSREASAEFLDFTGFFLPFFSISWRPILFKHMKELSICEVWPVNTLTWALCEMEWGTAGSSFLLCYHPIIVNELAMLSINQFVQHRRLNESIWRKQKKRREERNYLRCVKRKQKDGIKKLFMRKIGRRVILNTKVVL